MSDFPTCFFDVTDCTGNCCEEGRLMYERYCEEKYGEYEEDISQVRDEKLNQLGIKDE